MDEHPLVKLLAERLTLGDLLETTRRLFEGYDLVRHHTQGEFHHDVVLRVHAPGALPGPYLVVATNCNGGVKEVLCTAQPPEPSALWRWRCPESREFVGELPVVLGLARTLHWFDPCELLAPDARSELRPEHRERQPGGGWRMCRRQPD
jgi:hypothetical protein